MSATTERPVAFYHRDGLVPAWDFASRFAGSSGHIATLPEIVELRLGSKPGADDSPWENWYTSASAEYVGVGADGRVKIIVAHGVGPMSTIDGIKAAYKWEWGDKTRNKRGGRITNQQFLDLEAGKYGESKVIGVFDFCGPFGMFVRDFDFTPVNVLDFQDYLDGLGSDDVTNYLTTPEALRDPLIRIRLGNNGFRYLVRHMHIAKEFHRDERPNEQHTWSQGFDDRNSPYITQVEFASNCWYTTVVDSKKPYAEWEWVPRIPEAGYALAHLLDINRLTHTSTQEVGTFLATSPGVHEWWNGSKFIAIPEGASLDNGLNESIDPAKAIREHWKHFMQPVEDGYSPITPFLLKHDIRGEWFACYPKEIPDDACMDTGDIEFHVRSVEPIGENGTFTTDEMFFLRYKLSQVKAIMPRGANAYEIIDISTKNAQGLTTVLVRFYQADVDTTRRLPRTKEVARDYDRLMEVSNR